MKKQLYSASLMALLVISTALGQPRSTIQGDGSRILAAGDPPLTQLMVSRIESLFEFLLEIRLSVAERDQFQQGVARYWIRNDRESMESILVNLKYVDLSADELRAFRESNQATIVENMRRDTDNPEEAVLIRAYDSAHPDRQRATHAKGFTDLVGTWSREDALLANRAPYSGGMTGVSYTDSGTIEVAANGAFKSVKQHTHCDSGCCRLEGEEGFGTVSIDGSMLVFEIKGGSKLVQDDCIRNGSQRVSVAPHRESYKWAIRANPNTNATMLCWNTAPDKAVCYEKE